ncbi:MAG: serine hydrolase [Candidatus Wallbacteria bacterium]|nr:serine hydrolase [Candidatus Wallbacteria bacterium]
MKKKQLAVLLLFTGLRALCAIDEAEYFHNLFAPELRINSLFSQSFLSAVPEAKIREIIKLYVDNLGLFKKAVVTDEGYEIYFEKGHCPAKIVVGSEKLITGLWFGSWNIEGDSWDKIAADFADLPGVVSVAVTRDGELLVSINPGLPMAVGSAFKLYVLKALIGMMDMATLQMNDVISLKEEWISLPSGILQDWPAGSLLTVQSMANLMISISDNTATDALIHSAGRETVEAVAPERMKPFLTTKEMFELKWGVSDEVRERFVAADLSGKRRILESLRSFDKNRIRFSPSPKCVQSIEWLATTGELCRVIYELRENSAIRINPGLADKKKWHLIGYKGGSEGGVLNYTHVLQKTPSSPVYCISATINDIEKEVADKDFTALTGRLIGLAGTEALDKISAAKSSQVTGENRDRP